MKNNAIKVFGLNSLHENTAIKFTTKGMLISTGLNISKELIPFIDFNKNYSGQVFKGKCMYCYKKAMFIPSVLINNNNIIKIQKELLRLVQIDINLAKIDNLSGVVKKLKNI